VEQTGFRVAQGPAHFNVPTNPTFGRNPDAEVTDQSSREAIENKLANRFRRRRSRSHRGDLVPFDQVEIMERRIAVRAGVFPQEFEAALQMGDRIDHAAMVGVKHPQRGSGLRFQQNVVGLRGGNDGSNQLILRTGLRVKLDSDAPGLRVFVRNH